MKYFFLLILIAASIGTFVLFINPKFQDISSQQSDIATYTQRLQTAEKLKQSREQLIATYNSIQQSDLNNLMTLLPDSVDNIRLIIQLNALALKNGLTTVQNVQYDTDTKPATNAATGAPQAPYGTFQISFQTSGAYENFLAFVSDMESNLRLVDITSATFTPVNATTGADNELYKVTLDTYWLQQQ